jgi:hypothetical protein
MASHLIGLGLLLALASMLDRVTAPLAAEAQQRLGLTIPQELLLRADRVIE